MLKGLNDAALMARFQDGDSRAFEVLLRRHRKPVYNFILRSVRSQATAEDLLQEVFLRVIRSAKSFRREAKFTTWVYSIARNMIIDHSRRMKFRNHASLDKPLKGKDGDSRGAMLDLVSDGHHGASPSRAATSNELRERLQEAIDSLSDEQKEVFMMREYVGLQFKEIAEIVGCPENTVKSRMRYALEALRKRLREYKDLAKATSVGNAAGSIRAS